MRRSAGHLSAALAPERRHLQLAAEGIVRARYAGASLPTACGSNTGTRRISARIEDRAKHA